MSASCEPHTCRTPRLTAFSKHGHRGTVACVIPWLRLVASSFHSHLAIAMIRGGLALA